MRAFADAYTVFVQEPLAQIHGDTIVQEPLAQITWYHQITLLDKLNDEKARLFYLTKTAENGWSRNTMVHQIERGLYERQGKLLRILMQRFRHTKVTSQRKFGKTRTNLIF